MPGRFSFRAKERVILAVLVFLAFGNTLRHGFVGDDEAVIEKNKFYQSSHNLRRLFDRSYLTRSNDIFIKSAEYDSSGSVAYRPVLSLTYFMDYRLWGPNPFGFHLTNVVLHLCNVLLLYQLVFFLTGQKSAGFWGACLFAIHPVQSEAVANLSYRGDLVAAFFFLAAALQYFAFRQKSGGAGSILKIVLAAALAYFSKESAVVLIPVWLGYEVFFKNVNGPLLRVRPLLTWTILGGVTAGYLYVYFVVFPNTTVDEISLSDNLLVKFFLSLWTVTLYIKDIIHPAGLNPLPALFNYNLPENIAGGTILSLSVMVGFIYGLVKLAPRNRAAAFLGFWFLIALVPVSQILPNVNPVAHRFLYLPLAGLAPFLVLFAQTAQSGLKITVPAVYARMAQFLIVGVLLISTIYTNSLWSHNLIIGKNWIKNYPRHPQSYTSVGIEYYRALQCDEAKTYLLKAKALGDSNPQIGPLLAECSGDDFQESRTYLLESIGRHPEYAKAHYLLGELYFKNGRYEESLGPLLRSLDLEPTLQAAFYAIDAFRNLDKNDQAGQVLDAAREVFPADEFDQLEEMVGQF
jgi:tetratricopeptide (TPR) repeat protein